MTKVNRLQLLKSYHSDNFSLIPLKPKSKPLVKWRSYELSSGDFLHFLKQDSNRACRCDEHLHALDFNDAETYTSFIEGEGRVLKDAPAIRTARGFDTWFKPKKPVNSFSQNGIEDKGLCKLQVNDGGKRQW